MWGGNEGWDFVWDGVGLRVFDGSSAGMVCLNVHMVYQYDLWGSFFGGDGVWNG